MKKSTKNILTIAFPLIVFLILAVALLPSETTITNLSETATVGTITTGNEFTVTLKHSGTPALYDCKWDLVKNPDNSRLLSWDKINVDNAGVYRPGSSIFTFESLYIGTEDITFVYWDSYKQDIQKEVTITITTIK